MNLCPFETIDVLTETIPGVPFPQLPSIAERAAKLLSKRSHEEIVNGSKLLAWLVDSYFENIVLTEFPRLTGRFTDEFNNGTLPFNVDSLSPDEFDKAVENYTSNYIRPENMTEFMALKNCIKLYKLDSPNFPDAYEYEFFAILSLWLVVDSLDWISFRSGKTKYLTNNISENFIAQFNNSKSFKFSQLCFASIVALEALNSVCYAEHLASVEAKASEMSKTLISLKARNNAIKRHAKNTVNIELAVKLFSEKNWCSTRQAAIAIAPKILANGKLTGREYSEQQIENTVDNWLREA